MPASTPIGRFAPTPSGGMHLGNLFTALLVWLSARAAGGKVVLRVEDLDLQRTSPAFTRQILEDLAWFGLDWDEGPGRGGSCGPYWQSLRSDFYTAQLSKLQSKGLVYPCFCSRAQLHAAEAPHAADGNYVYGGRCRSLSPQRAAEKAAGRPPAVRVRVPDETITFTDGCRGPYSQNLKADCGDFILRRSDGVFAYQLAATADDGAMGITQVVRGADLLPSTPRQIWLLRTLGFPVPQYYHTPLLLDHAGRRLSKREADLQLATLRQKQPDPRPLVGHLARLAGLWPGGRPATATTLIPHFQWAAVPKQNIRLPENYAQGLLQP